MAQGGLRLGRSGTFVAAALLALGACAASVAVSQPKTLTPPPPPAPPAPSPAPVALTPPPPASLPRDECGARPLQYLVGRSRDDIPVPVYPSRRRVVCSTCVMSQTFIPSRLTIVYDSGTGLVKSVRCG